MQAGDQQAAQHGQAVCAPAVHRRHPLGGAAGKSAALRAAAWSLPYSPLPCLRTCRPRTPSPGPCCWVAAGVACVGVAAVAAVSVAPLWRQGSPAASAHRAAAGSVRHGLWLAGDSADGGGDHVLLPHLHQNPVPGGWRLLRVVFVRNVRASTPCLSEVACCLAKVLSRWVHALFVRTQHG